jgi:membrane fusion protein, multidrug efflux system
MTRIARSAAILTLVLTATAAAACSKNGEARPEAPSVGRPPVAVTVAPVVPADLQENVDVVGTLAPKFVADVKSEVTGVVTEVYVTEWVPVRKGDRLARLDTRETEAGIEALKAVEAQARVAENRAKREYERAQQLQKYGLITPQAFDDAKSAVDAAEATTAAARAQIKTAEARLAKSFLTAPMTGVVALRGVNVGDRLENMGSGSPAFRIVDNSLLDLTVSVPSSHLASVRVGQTVDFSTDSLPGRAFAGKVMFINPEIDAASRSAKVIAEVRNTDGQLKGGAFAKGRIVVGTRKGVLQVPREALVNWNPEARTAEVYVVRGEAADRREVKTGAMNDGSVEVTSGLQANDQVITRGALSLKPGDRIAVAKGEGA